MFERATSFNQDISGWDMSSATDLDAMFYSAESFDQDLGDWNIASVTEIYDMLSNSGLSPANYDATLMKWSNQPNLKTSRAFTAANVQYCDEAGRQKLIDDFGWQITDGGKSEVCDSSTQRPFITTWKTDNPGKSAIEFIKNFNCCRISCFNHFC